jgi:hypothetical protein
MTNLQPDAPTAAQSRPYSLAAAHQMLEQFGSTPETAKVILLKEKAAFETAVAQKQAVWMDARGEGVWSVAQIVEHVILASSLFATGVRQFQKPVLPEIPPTLGVFKNGKAQSPSHVLPSAGKTWEELEPLWEAAHHKWLELISSTDWTDTRTLEHPFFGPLHPLQWLQCTNYHTHHHLQQL